jgi:hypothetical protein
MPSRSVKRKHNRKRLLFKEQDGRCYWCKRRLARLKGPANGVQADDEATLDHLYGARDPRRPNRAANLQTVLACWKCNHERGEDYRAEVAAALAGAKAAGIDPEAVRTPETPPAGPLRPSEPRARQRARRRQRRAAQSSPAHPGPSPSRPDIRET